MTFNEDRSAVRAKSAPGLLLALRNLVMNLFRKMGKRNIAEATRECRYSMGFDLKTLTLVA